MSYTIKLPVFEGPFDLLLHLIRVNEMDIHDIQVAEITSQYLAFLDLMRELDLDVAGDFLVMAATLLHLKTRILLPVPPDPEDQEEEIDEILSAKELVRQLVEYRRFKEAASVLRVYEDQAGKTLYRTVAPPAPPQPEEEELTADLDILYKAFARVLRFVDSPQYNPILTEQYSVEEKIEYLQELMARDGTTDLELVMQRCFNKQEIITTFLAVLELCRMKKVAIEQDNAFDRILLTPGTGSLEDDDAESDDAD